LDTKPLKKKGMSQIPGNQFAIQLNSDGNWYEYSSLGGFGSSGVLCRTAR
jgi:hypothetical protein